MTLKKSSKPEKTAKAAAGRRTTARSNANVKASKPKKEAPAKSSPPSKISAPAKGPPSAKKAPAIPPILLEGDAPTSAPKSSGPGDRYVLAPESDWESSSSAAAMEASATLPEAYGTKNLYLTARDPHWLYAHWDLTAEQQREYNKQSAANHLAVRVYLDRLEGEPCAEVGVHPESRNWFIHVDRAESKYFAKLGYYDKKKKWVTISNSKATLTPPDNVSNDTSFSWETLPADLQLQRLVELVQSAMQQHVPLLEAVQELRASGHPNLPPREALRAHEWTPAQARALAEIISMDEVRRVWVGSLEITELIKRQLHRQISSESAAQFSLPSSWSGGVSSFSSPVGGLPAGKKSFWFNVNAELIIYGATEPDASVTVAGRKVQLRPDGTFSFRFALPDGDYHLPLQAVAADASDQRSAALQFTRGTNYEGDVGQHPQDPKLKTPRPENMD